MLMLQKSLALEQVCCVEASSPEAITAAISSEIDLIVMSEAALTEDAVMQQIARKLIDQPEWSDISTILLLKGKRRSRNFETFWEMTAYRRSVILLQTPVKPSVFLSIVRARLQDRQRQHVLRLVLSDLEESNRTLESFSYTAAHELRNPLGILNSSFSILERTDLTSKQAQFVEMGLRTARSMDQTLQALLDYGKLQADRESFQTVDMNSVAAQAVDGLQSLIDTRQAQVSWQSLPNVRGNQQLLIQLVSNLVKNAVVHNLSQTPEVTLQAHGAEGRWIIHVIDNGPGISEENQKKIFSLFDRAGKSRAEGSGIGLALCRRIVEQHGGEIRVQSGVGHGSDFYFDLARIVARA